MFGIGTVKVQTVAELRTDKIIYNRPKKQKYIKSKSNTCRSEGAAVKRNKM